MVCPLKPVTFAITSTYPETVVLATGAVIVTSGGRGTLLKSTDICEYPFLEPPSMAVTFKVCAPLA